MERAKSVSELVERFINNLKYRLRRVYVASSPIRDNKELEILTRIVAIETNNTIIFSRRGNDLTVERFAQLMWDKYYNR